MKLRSCQFPFTGDEEIIWECVTFNIFFLTLLFYNLQCPTTIVPFFGDQFFWGDRVHQKGLGPAPIPIAELSVDKLSSAITFMLQPEVTLFLMNLSFYFSFSSSSIYWDNASCCCIFHSCTYKNNLIYGPLHQVI